MGLLVPWCVSEGGEGLGAFGGVGFGAGEGDEGGLGFMGDVEGVGHDFGELFRRPSFVPLELTHAVDGYANLVS